MEAGDTMSDFYGPIFTKVSQSGRAPGKNSEWSGISCCAHWLFNGQIMRGHQMHVAPTPMSQKVHNW